MPCYSHRNRGVTGWAAPPSLRRFTCKSGRLRGRKYMEYPIGWTKWEDVSACTRFPSRKLYEINLTSENTPFFLLRSSDNWVGFLIPRALCSMTVSYRVACFVPPTFALYFRCPTKHVVSVGFNPKNVKLRFFKELNIIRLANKRLFRQVFSKVSSTEWNIRSGQKGGGSFLLGWGDRASVIKIS